MADEESPPEEVPRARKRSVNVCALDDETLQRLNADFERYDADKTGVLTHDQVKQLMIESYDPTEAEVTNVCGCLARGEEKVSFNDYLFAFHRCFRVHTGDPQQRDEAYMFEHFASELHSMAKTGKCTLQEAECSEEAIAEAKADLGAEWVGSLEARFKSFSEDGSTQLNMADLKKLIKAAFTPSEEKIDKVMQFFAMTGAGDLINQMNFISGMTLLYGDLGHLAASPVKN